MLLSVYGQIMSSSMANRSSIPNYIDAANNLCYVVCNRHGRINARISQQGRNYHSCSVWNPSVHQFVPFPAANATERCTVHFVFCNEHKQSTTMTTEERTTPSVISVRKPDSEVLLSNFLTPPSPQTEQQQQQLPLSQQRLIEEFNDLMDSL